MNNFRKCKQKKCKADLFDLTELKTGHCRIHHKKLNRMKYLRLHLGYTQQDFSERLGITQGYLSKLESNQLKPTFDVLKNLREEFGINLNAFITTYG